MISFRRASWAALALAAIVGCQTEDGATAPEGAAAPSASQSTPDPSSPPAGTLSDEAKDATSPAPEAPKGESPQASVTLSEDEIAEIKQLPADEQPLALKQAVCPSSGEHLGSMGKPIKVTAKGQTFFLCCSGCEGDVKSDPDAILAKLNKK